MSKLEMRRSKRSQSYPIITDESTCLGGSSLSREDELRLHWDNAYNNSSEDKLGWYETDVSPTMELINKASLKKEDGIIIIGAGSTTLIDRLLEDGYTNLIATDISNTALRNLKKRLAERAINVEFIVDNLIKPTLLNNVSSVDLWIDRAVLHFFTDTQDQDNYFNLLRRKIASCGYVLLAQFSLEGATKCTGLDVHRYSKEKLVDKLGNDFTLLESFAHIYTMPSGDTRPYIYTLFQRVSF